MPQTSKKIEGTEGLIAMHSLDTKEESRVRLLTHLSPLLSIMLLSLPSPRRGASDEWITTVQEGTAPECPADSQTAPGLFELVNVTGNPGVFQGHPHPSKSVPATPPQVRVSTGAAQGFHQTHGS